MLCNAELLFIKTFIKKNRRERLSFELASDKRQDAIWRFCHGARGLLIEDKMHPIIIGEGGIDYLYSTMLSCGATADDAYVISLTQEDAREMKLYDALQKVVYYGPCIVISSKPIVAYLETEQNPGAPLRYLLY